MRRDSSGEVAKSYSARKTADKLRRLAECLAAGRPFHVQIAGRKVIVPPDAVVSIEHERDGADAELEIEIRWRAAPARTRRQRRSSRTT